MERTIPKETLWQQFVKMDDSKAFEALFYKLNSRLIKFCIYYVHQSEVAEEIVSDVFVKCWQTRATLQHITNPETFLFVCVKNQALNYQKKMSTIHLVSIDEYTSELVDTSSPDLKIEREELIFKLNQAVETLPLQCKIIFRLLKEDGLKYKEVSEILNISVKTVQTQLFRAMKKLSIIMQEHDDPSPSAHLRKLYHFIPLGIFISACLWYL